MYLKYKANSPFSASNKTYHIIFISILILNYLFPLLIFGDITLFYHDQLDVGVVYNKVIGEYLRGNPNAFNKFLGGVIEGNYFKELYKPYSLFYAIFNTELSFWLLHFLIRITSYISFFILAKKISINIFFCALSACLFASLNSNALEGFGVAIFPYLVYLCMYKKSLRLKHYFVLIFFGANTDLVGSVLSPVLLLITLSIINLNVIKKNFIHICKILIIFFVPAIITSINLIFLIFGDIVFHRDYFLKESPNIYKNFFNIFRNIFRFPSGINWTIFANLPYNILLIPLIFFSIISKEKVIKNFTFLIFILYFLAFIFDLQIFVNLKNNIFFLKAYRFSWIFIYVPFLFSLIALYLIDLSKFRNIIIFFSILSLISFQINSSAVPFIKKFIVNDDKSTYQNVYTFKGYYTSEKYLEIKKIVKDNRVLSVNLDPMVAVMNDINVIDGYHTLYPNSYKIKFRKIIEKELNRNETLKNYYDNWGSRVYAFVNDKDDIKLNFSEAKKLGAKYIVSKYQINSDILVRDCVKCKTDLFLYKIM